MLTVAVCIWAGAVFLGILALARYSNTAGAQPHFSAQEAGGRDRFRLVMFVHPRCPCSRASVEELSRLMGASGGKIRGELYVFHPDSESDEWSDTWIRQHADLIPNVDVITDRNAAVARSYSASTSGQVMLYDAAGDLLFSGGITAARGHEGDNRGRSAVVELVSGADAEELIEAPVFGCPLFDDQLTGRFDD
ncbi:MAG: hypothetical protein NXI04_17140 [Planctomycetaceae bacterium]|nr:hypothetical protein [Planctomycetaceae bacterium]